MGLNMIKAICTTVLKCFRFEFSFGGLDKIITFYEVFLKFKQSKLNIL